MGRGKGSLSHGPVLGMVAHAQCSSLPGRNAGLMGLIA